jgi:hypothetical protein
MNHLIDELLRRWSAERGEDEGMLASIKARIMKALPWHAVAETLHWRARR